MMYNNKLAAAIKVAGKVLREFDKDKIYLPYGSEYSIYLKNMSSKRAVAHITIDGVDIGGGRGFVVPANGSVEIERSFSNGNMEQGNRFKFIERSSTVEEYRGISVEDGLVQIQFQFEMKVTSKIWNKPYDGWNPYNPWTEYPSITYGSQVTSAVSSTSQENYDYATAVAQNETGITVPGSISDQMFSEASPILLESTKHTMVFHLLGETEANREVRQPVTVKHKPKCVTCGTINCYDAKFCSECGTSLQIV